MKRYELNMNPGIGLMKRRLEKEKDAIALAISGIAKKYDKKPKELKTLDNYRKDLIECREYDLILKDMSDKQIDFDLDDGVTENYKLFEGVVSKI